MRTYGRTYNQDGSYQWVEVSTDENGFNDEVYLTTLIQNLKLNLGESPFWANNGIPAQKSVISQIAPDYYVQQIQQQFSQYFSSLLIQKTQPSLQSITPTYRVNVLTNQGARLTMEIPI
jgi:hypothetical protein